MRTKLQEKYEQQAESAFRSLIMKKACDGMTVEVPDAMIQEKAEEMIRNYAANFGMTDRKVDMQQLVRMLGIDAETMNQSILPSAEFQVRSDLLVEAVAAAEGIEPTEEELEAYIEKIAASVNAKPEDIKAYFDHDFIVAEFKKEKATDLIYGSAVVGEEEEPAQEPEAKEE